MLPVNNNLLVYSLCIFLVTGSCSQRQEKVEQSTSDMEWPEMESFHMTMAEAFHPLKDSGNVLPAIELMGQLAEEAEKWATAPLPQKVDTEEVKTKLQKLRTDIRALSDEVNDGAPEDQVGTALFTIHDQFHEIMELWHGGVKHEEEEKH